MRILVLEDDDDLRESLADLAALEGRECLTARSMAEVQAHADEALACGLAILDINLGEGVPSGIDAYRWLRERSFAGDIVLLTGHASTHPLVMQASVLDGATVLAKPLGLDRLRQLIRGPRAAS